MYVKKGIVHCTIIVHGKSCFASWQKGCEECRRGRVISLTPVSTLATCVDQRDIVLHWVISCM